MAKLFFLLSGEHETLPASELKAVLETEDFAFRTLQKIDQVLRIDAGIECIDAVKRRAAFTRLCGLELVDCEAEATAIIKTVRSTSLEKVL